MYSPSPVFKYTILSNSQFCICSLQMKTLTGNIKFTLLVFIRFIKMKTDNDLVSYIASNISIKPLENL